MTSCRFSSIHVVKTVPLLVSELEKLKIKCSRKSVCFVVKIHMHTSIFYFIVFWFISPLIVELLGVAYKIHC